MIDVIYERPLNNNMTAHISTDPQDMWTDRRKRPIKLLHKRNDIKMHATRLVQQITLVTEREKKIFLRERLNCCWESASFMLCYAFHFQSMSRFRKGNTLPRPKRFFFVRFFLVHFIWSSVLTVALMCSDVLKNRKFGIKILME